MTTNQSRTGMFLSKLLYGALLVALLISIAACSDTTPAGTPVGGDDRPEGTVKVLLLFSHFCDLSAGAKLYVYADDNLLRGELIDSQRVENREVSLFLEPLTPVHINVLSGGEEIVPETTIYSSDRDVQLDSLVRQ